jgi:pentatricopeptide repeat protein
MTNNSFSLASLTTVLTQALWREYGWRSSRSRATRCLRVGGAKYSVRTTHWLPHTFQKEESCTPKPRKLALSLTVSIRGGGSAKSGVLTSASPRSRNLDLKSVATKDVADLSVAVITGKYHELSSRELNKALQHLGSSPEWQTVFDVFDQLCSLADYQNRILNSHVATTVLSLAGRKGDLNRVHRTFQWMQSSGVRRTAPTAHTYTAYIQSVCSAGKWREAFRIYEDMLREGVMPTTHTYSALIRGGSKGGRAGALAATALISEMRASGISPDVPLASALICAYGVLGEFSNAERLLSAIEAVATRSSISFDCCGQLKSSNLHYITHLQQQKRKRRQLDSIARHWPDAMLYTEFMVAACRCGRPDAATIVFESISPQTTYTCTAAIKAYGECGEWRKAESLYKIMSRSGTAMPPSCISQSALLSAYEKAGKWDRAITFLHNIHAVGTISDLVAGSRSKEIEIHYNITMSACGKAGEWERAEDLFEELVSLGIKPSTVTYSTLIFSYGHGNEEQRANLCFNKMMMAPELSPDDYTFVGLLRGPSTRGDLSRCQEIKSSMSSFGVVPTVHVYNELIRAADVSSRYETAVELYQQMVSEGIEPNTTTQELVQCVGKKGVEFYKDKQLAANFASLVAGLVGVAGIVVGRW